MRCTVCSDTTVERDWCRADGRWHCVDCHETFPNNLAADFHQSAQPDHRLGWACFEHPGILEVEPA